MGREPSAAVARDGTLVLEPRDTFDPCLRGTAHRGGEVVALYSRACVLAALEAEGLSREDALDHYGFNVSGSVGWGFPMFILDRDDDDPGYEPGPG